MNNVLALKCSEAEQGKGNISPPLWLCCFHYLFFFHWDRLPEKLLEKFLLAIGLGVHHEPQSFLAYLQEI